MKTWICEICGDAYIGEHKPGECPFCGSKGNFIKPGSEARPIVNDKVELSEQSIANLQETLKLEIEAYGIYLCIAGKSENYEINKMYKRLAKVELEHANVCCKMMGIAMPETPEEVCAETQVENFQRTMELEDHATGLYARFAKEATEREVRILFTALSRVELDHAELIKNYL